MSKSKVSKVKLLESDEKKQIYYIKHDTSKDIHILNNNAWKNSTLLNNIIDTPSSAEKYGTFENPIKIRVVKEHTLSTIIQYLNYYSDINEKLAPSTPLDKIHISEIFGDEYVIFKPIIGEKKEITQHLTDINEYIEASLYFGIDELGKKLCAIISYFLRDLNINELNNILTE